MSNRTSISTIDLSSTGIAGDGKRPVLTPPETYFNTLFEAVEAWYIHLAAKADWKGYGTPEIALSDLEMSPMYEGENQSFFVALVGGKGTHGIYISIYKRDEGCRVYEATAYIS